VKFGHRSAQAPPVIGVGLAGAARTSRVVVLTLACP
jgi:hypothetical protein